MTTGADQNSDNQRMSLLLLLLLTGAATLADDEIV